MNQVESIQKNILNNLQKVIDPETGMDVVTMRLIEDLQIEENGAVSYVFRPSSPVCPIAVNLALDIINAVSEAEGVTSQNIAVRDYIASEQLTGILQQYLDTLAQRRNQST